MATTRRHPFGAFVRPTALPTMAGSQYTASSKSRASSPSMVTRATSVRSMRFLQSTARTLSGKAAACDNVCGEKRCGTSYLRTAISISMPGSSISPSTSVTRPTGCEYMEGGSVSSMATTCPALALAIAFFGTKMSCPYRLSSGATSQMPLSCSRRPMMGALRRSTISRTRPSGRPLRS